MNKEQTNELVRLYCNDYYKVLKPLLAELEALTQYISAELLNEIRSFNDHISRCYFPNATEKSIDKNIAKADGHLRRAILDSLKHLCLYYYDEVNKFEEKLKDVDLTLVDSGKFYPEFGKLKVCAQNLVREAKIKETLDFEASFELFQDATNKYRELYNFINDHLEQIDWAKKRTPKKKNKIIAVFLWLASVVVACVIKEIIDYYKVIPTIVTFVTKLLPKKI